MEYRQLTKEDAKEYRDIRLEMLQAEPTAFGESYGENLKYDIGFFEDRIKNSNIFVACVEGKLIGTAGSFIQDKIKVAHKAYLWGVYTNPTARGAGVSYRLVSNVLDALPESVELIQTTVVSGNAPAIKTYEKAGFQEWGIEEKALKVNNQYYDEIHMVKFLK